MDKIVPIDEMSKRVTWAQTSELSHAILHEVKNRLVILNGLLSTIPPTGNPEHDNPLNEALSLCQRVSGEAIQTLILYWADVSGNMYLNAKDIYSPLEFVAELAQAAISLSWNRLIIEACAEDDVPNEWSFDRNLLNLAIMNAIHNCLKYAKTDVRLKLSMEDDMLKISVSDDSGWYPEHILKSDVSDVKDVKAGTGLWLRFANFIAKAHKKDGRSGFVRLCNDGNRAVFEILIP